MSKDKPNDYMYSHYLVGIIMLRDHNAPLSAWYRKQGDILKEKKEFLSVEQKNKLLSKIDSGVSKIETEASSAEYESIKDKKYTFSSNNEDIFNRDLERSLADYEIQVIKGMDELRLSSRDNRAYFGDERRGIFDRQKYIAKNPAIFGEDSTKILHGLDKIASDLDYKRNIDTVIKTYM